MGVEVGVEAGDGDGVEVEVAIEVEFEVKGEARSTFFFQITSLVLDSASLSCHFAACRSARAFNFSASN